MKKERLLLLRLLLSKLSVERMRVEESQMNAKREEACCSEASLSFSRALTTENKKAEAYTSKLHVRSRVWWRCLAVGLLL